jgi:malonyl-CoA O-methyltransferase
MQKTTVDKKLMKDHFSAGAARYDDCAKIQERMAGILADSDALKSLNPGGKLKILEIGCGTGILTGKLTGLFPHASISAIDIAPGMIKAAGMKNNSPGVIYICGDAEKYRWDDSFDLVISNAAFQWMNDPRGTVSKYYSLLKPSGGLVFSTFGPGTFREFFNSYKKAAEELSCSDYYYPGLKFHDAGEWLGWCKFASRGSRSAILNEERFFYEHFRSSRECLDSIRMIGAKNSNAKRHPESCRLLKIAMANYDGSFPGDKTVTYQALFFSIFKTGGRTVK